MPPRIVIKKSLRGGGRFSPKFSHVADPSTTSGADAMKLSPLARPALKYQLPLRGWPSMLVSNLSSSHSQAALRLRENVSPDTRAHSALKTQRLSRLSARLVNRTSVAASSGREGGCGRRDCAVAGGAVAAIAATANGRTKRVI